MNPHSKYFEICCSFQELASWTWHKLARADRLNMAFNEETITESLLLKLAERHSGRGLTIRSYTKTEEGTGTPATGGEPTGADWSFWFGNTRGQGIEVRIQAKKLFTKSGKYESLDGNDQQIRKLIENCGDAIPLYVFYNAPIKDLNAWPIYLRKFSTISSLGGYWPFNLPDLGCSFSPVTAIPPKNQPRPNEILWMKPWHYLLCDFFMTPNKHELLAIRIAAVLKNAYESMKLEGVDILNKYPNISFELHKQPYWVGLLDKNIDHEGLSNPSLNDYLIQNGLNGIAYILETSQ